MLEWLSSHSKRVFIRGKLVALPIALSLPLIAHAQARTVGGPEVGRQGYRHWRIEDTFDNGIPSWQSYPLAQDIGYDPSLYTVKIAQDSALRRDVVNDGQAIQRIGMIRSIHCRFDRSSQISFVYSIETSARPAFIQVVIAASDGRKYETNTAVRRGSRSTVHLSGSQFHLRGGHVQIEAVIILTKVRNIPLGAHSILTLHTFSIDAWRPMAPTMISPRTLVSSDGSMPIADHAVEAGLSTVFRFASGPTSVTAKDGEGNRAPAVASINGKKVTWTPAKEASPGLWTISVTDARGTLTFRILVLSDRSAGMGILLSPERLQQLRTEGGFASLRQAIHAEAVLLGQQLQFNRNAGTNIALLPSESVFAGLSVYADLLDRYGAAILYNALDYRLTGDPRALNTATKALLTVSAWQTWTPPWFTSHGLHTYYIVGIFTEQLAAGFDLVEDRLSLEERRTVERATLRNSIEPTVEDYYMQQRMPTGASNHMAHSIGGALAAWAAFDRADPEWRVEQGTSLAELIDGFEVLFRGLFPGDGSEAEPASYEEFAMEGVSYGISSLASLGISPANVQPMLDSFWWLRYADLSPLLVLDAGDTHPALKALSGYAWLAEHDPDPAARWLYDSVSRPLLDSAQAGTGSAYHAPGPEQIQQAPDVLDLLCCTRPAVTFAPPQPSRIFERRGSIVFRDRWDDPEMATSIRIGPWMNHEHHDQGSFQIAVHGDLVIGEGGYADYYRDPNYKTYFSEAPAHNVVLVDHDAFSQIAVDGRYWKALSSFPKIVSSFLEDGFGYIDADLTPAYGASLRRYRRQFFFLAPNLFVIRDDITSAAPHIFNWLLHPAASVDVQRHDTDVVLTSQQTGASLGVVAEEPNISWQLTDTPVAVNEFSDLDSQTISRRQVLSLQSVPTRRQQFLVGFAAGNSNHSPQIERVTTGSGRGFRLRGSEGRSVVLFRNGKGTLSVTGASTDGDLLALTMSGLSDSTSMFSINSRWIMSDDGNGVTLSSPGACLWNQAGSSVNVVVSVHEDAQIRVHGEIQSGSLKMDGAASGSEIKLTAGQHRLEFQLAAGLTQAVRKEHPDMPGGISKP